MSHADGVAADICVTSVPLPAICKPRPTWSTQANTCSAPKRWWLVGFRPDYASLVALHAQAGAASSAPPAMPCRWKPMAVCAANRSACARCCWLSRATCAWCCCAWPRGCTTLRWYAASKTAVPAAVGAGIDAGVRAAGQPVGHLADQVGAGRPGFPFHAAGRLQAHRRTACTRRAASAKPGDRGDREPASKPCCSMGGVRAEVQGRPKHLYSIWKKMQGKGLPFEQVFDVRALRVIVADTAACYSALERVHEALHAGGRRVRRLHRQTQGQRLPVAAHRGAA